MNKPTFRIYRLCIQLCFLFLFSCSFVYCFQKFLKTIIKTRNNDLYMKKETFFLCVFFFLSTKQKKRKKKVSTCGPSDALDRQPRGQPFSWLPNNSIWKGWLREVVTTEYKSSEENSGEAQKAEKTKATTHNFLVFHLLFLFLNTDRQHLTFFFKKKKEKKKKSWK